MISKRRFWLEPVRPSAIFGRFRLMTARLCRRFERSFSLLFGMRQSRLLGERRAKATMVSQRLAALPALRQNELSSFH